MEKITLGWSLSLKERETIAYTRQDTQKTLNKNK